MSTNPAEMYGEADLQKVAEAELFTKLAAQNGIDLNQLDNEQIQTLWDATFSKVAEEEPKKEEEEEKKDEAKEEEEKKEAAALEHQQKLAAVEEDANAYKLGMSMAQGYYDHLQKLASGEAAEVAAPVEGEDKEAGAKDKVLKAVGHVRDVAKRGGEHVAKAVTKNHGKFPAAPPHNGPHISGLRRASRAAGEHVRAHKGAYGAGAAGAGGAAAGFAAGRHSKKEASAIDQLALEEAVKIAAAGGYDAEQAADLVSAVFTLGLEESSKLASTVDAQVNLRALEYLEAAGYPVSWDQSFEAGQ
jgi:hypothetical protein